MRFADRTEAGRLLAQRLLERPPAHPVVLGLPRGGVPVAAEIASALSAPLDVLLARKIGAPGNPELAIGAVVDAGEPIIQLDAPLVEALSVSEPYLAQEIARQIGLLKRRRQLYAEARPKLAVRGRTVIVVDDGIATGATLKAGIAGLRRRQPGRVILAVPVASAESLRDLGDRVDEVVCLHRADGFGALGAFYGDFRQIDDEEVIRLLRGANLPAERAAMESR